MKIKYLMINFNFVSNIFLVIFLSFKVLVLYFLRNVKPIVSRNKQVFFETSGLLYSCTLIIHGERLDSILFFSQSLILIIVLIIGWENIRLRGYIKNMT